ncbi:VOC family protein [Desulfogranum mediterraneum]|uniref:VOC family protein n=1 Tax=Desulfogranum mediterraneum TaxID=160661 RepID=UPI0004226C8B|nr:VOC family protein [Desulfogranum mediterraneum]
MADHETINYLEFPARDLAASKDFFSRVFTWSFIDYGPEYTAFSSATMEGGFFLSTEVMSTAKGSALVVFYSSQLEQTLEKILASGGTIIKPTFSFPGGRRFHFADPNGNEFAVWSDLGN